MSRPPSLTLPSGARACRMETSRGSFAALDCGPLDGVPHTGTVLMLPGFIGSKEDFLPLLAPLSAAGIRAVAIDGRGQHESPGPQSAQAYAQHELVADVLALSAAISETAASVPLHLLGHSMGGHIARAAALSAVPPRPWATVTLMSSGPAAIQPDQQKRIKLLIQLLPVLGKEQLWQEMQKLETREPPTAAVADFLRQRWLNTVPEQLTVTGRQLLVEPDRVNELSQLSLPMLVVCGQEDYAWPVPQQLDMATRLGAHHAVIADSSHSPNVENPAATARALISFWESVGTSTRSDLRRPTIVQGAPPAADEREPKPA
ncbi:alpha/beta fold hydrolase [Streptomyces sp. NPDC006530]|uniref:alpha/beta fold hydrolase n=1 Tax=Streptomyces sp. NPDC006530 TaxID=3364750 RepID=UPI003698AD83